jgi:hypothetical protein
MCTYLDQVGSTYYFRRAVPDDLLGYFRTKTGKLRTEFKLSLKIKDREEAKRLIPLRTIDTDQLFADARAALAVHGMPAETAPASSPSSSLGEYEIEAMDFFAAEDAAQEGRRARSSPASAAEAHGVLHGRVSPARSRDKGLAPGAG